MTSRRKHIKYIRYIKAKHGTLWSVFDHSLVQTPGMTVSQVVGPLDKAREKAVYVITKYLALKP